MSSARSRSHSPEAAAALALTLVPGVGPVRQRELVARFGSAARALDAQLAEPRDLARTEADALLMRGAARGLALLCAADPEYPAALRDLGDPPAVLWVDGDAGLLDTPLVAMVGTRRATRYGDRVARELAAALARAGVGIVSGMARGIDAAAHEAALDAGGVTIAVLGTGADVAYPAAHRVLRGRIATNGAVLSELPPGTEATPGAFPRRNRIIAALAPLTIVVEAGCASGALLTAQHALELGRTVAAVPGPIDVSQSEGSNELLRDGAVVIAKTADALALVGRTAPVSARPAPEDADAHAAWTALAQGPLDLDTLATRSRLPAARCLAAVTRLELAGTVECELTGLVRRR